MLKPLLLLCLPLGLSACLLQPAPLPASAVVPPAAWDADAVAAVWPQADWWQALGSDELLALMQEAQRSNTDLEASAARLLQAEAQARVAGAVLLPSLDASGSATRSGVFGGPDSNSNHGYGLSLGASYEIDFWGGNRAGVQSARASLRASQYDQQTVALTVNSAVATAYLQVLSLRDRLVIARSNLANAERVLAVVAVRAEAGAVSQLDLAQQQAQVLSQRAALPGLEQQERDARSALALLLGRAPQGFSVQAASLAAVQVPEVGVGLPSELLQRRPDVRRAEAQWDAVEANRVVALANRFPSIRLSAGSGVQSGEFRSLLDGDPFWNAGLSLAQPLFQGGRLKAAYEAAEARVQEQMANYRAVVLNALAEAETALGNRQALEQQQYWQAQQLAQNQRMAELAEVRYQAGEVDLVTVLDAQRSLYQAQDQFQQLKLERLRATITLYRVMGGGWPAVEAEKTEPAEAGSGNE